MPIEDLESITGAAVEAMKGGRAEIDRPALLRAGPLAKMIQLKKMR
jgi:hypothetical protein